MARHKKPKVPDFGRVVRAFKDAKAVLEEEVRDFADEQAEDFKARIEDQNFPAFNATPLSPRYAERKEKLGLDPRIMIATGHYYKAIRVFQRKNRDGSITYYVGHDNRARARDHKGDIIPIFLNTLAAVHEKGSSKMNIPPRPHWQPHYALMHSLAESRRDAIRARVRTTVKRRLGTLAKA